MIKISLTVNGKPHQVTVYTSRTLLEVIREDLGLTGTKEGFAGWVKAGPAR